MTVRPRRVFTLGCSAWIEEALLREYDKGPLCMDPSPYGRLRTVDLVQPTSDMDRGRLRALLSLPRDWSVEGPVDFEDTRAVTKPLQLRPILGGQTRLGDARQLSRGHVEQDFLCFGNLFHGVDPGTDGNLASQRTKVRCHCVDDGLRASPSHRPPGHMSEQRQGESYGRGSRAIERLDGVRGHPGE